MKNDIAKIFKPASPNGGEANREAIIDFLKTGGVNNDLAEKQKVLLERWTYCDEIMRENVGLLKREEIAIMMMEKFNISRPTAYSDIVNTEYVYSTSAPLNKKYRTQLRIEFLEDLIRQAANKKEFGEVANLEKVLQKYYSDYPDVTSTNTPSTWIFNVDEKAILDSTIPISEAENYLDEVEKEYTDFEEVDPKKEAND